MMTTITVRDWLWSNDASDESHADLDLLDFDEEEEDQDESLAAKDAEKEGDENAGGTTSPVEEKLAAQPWNKPRPVDVTKFDLLPGLWRHISISYLPA